MTSKFKAAIFDLDGTLLDTLADLANATNAVLTGRGYPAQPRNAYKAFVGGGARNLIVRALTAIVGTAPADDLVEAMLTDFKAEYGQNWNVQTRAYDGVAELLADVDSLGLRSAILSNKPHEFTCLCAAAHFSPEQFDVILGVNDATPPKPDLTGLNRLLADWGVAPGEVVYLGDTGTDMKTARAAGCFAVGVTWGFRSRDELVENGADAIIDHPRELAALLR